MGIGITQTLREKLFDHPAPLGREWEFQSLAMEMFPGRSYFLSFLDERRFEEQVEIAKHILLRLAYQSRLAPPNKFLYNLLDTESRLAGSAIRAPFSGRDHFVHLVSLYLLGLYLFWYHGPFHARLSQQFYELAPMDGESRREKHISSCRGFLVAWREFILFHDLGYPWEVAQGTDDPASVLSPFGEIAGFSSKDSALFVISQLLALEWLRKEEIPALFEEEFRSIINMSDPLQTNMFTTQEQAVQSWAKSEKLPFTSDGGLWRLIQVIVPPQDRLSILETVGEGRLIGSPHPDLKDSFRIPPGLREEVADLLASSRWAESNTLPAALRERYHWVHFVRNYDTHFLRFTAELFPENSEIRGKFPLFLQQFLESFPPSHAVSDDLQFEDHAYAMFHRLLESLDFDTFDSDNIGSLVIHHSIARSEMKGLQGRLLKEVGDKLLELLRQRAEELDPDGEGSSINNTTLADYLRELLVPLQETDIQAQAIDNRLSKQVKERVTLKRFLYGYYTSLKKGITQRMPQAVPMIFPFTKKKTDTRTAKNRDATHPVGGGAPAIKGPDWEAFRQCVLFADIDSMLAERELGGIETLSQYSPRWAPKPRANAAVFVDHGLASGLLFAQVFQIQEGLRVDTHTRVGKLLNLRGMTDQKAVPHSLRLAASKVLYTIFIHNLYPEFFEENRKQFRTKLKREPFTYFALLCDSLQPWDRKRLLNQATGPLAYNTYAENFNIEIEGKILRITERGDQLRIDERQAALRGYLNSFLERGSDFVRLHLSEWRF